MRIALLIGVLLLPNPCDSTPAAPQVAPSPAITSLPPGACAAASDCPGTQTCENGRCVYRVSPAAAASDARASVRTIAQLGEPCDSVKGPACSGSLRCYEFMFGPQNVRNVCVEPDTCSGICPFPLHCCHARGSGMFSSRSCRIQHDCQD